MPKKLTREMDVFMQYGYAAAMEAIADAGEEIAVPERMGIVVGTALGGISPIAEVQDGLSKGEHKKSARALFRKLSATRQQPKWQLQKAIVVQV